MTDEDVIRKLHRFVGVGYVHEDPGNQRQNPNYKMMWRWSVARREDVTMVLTRIRPHMGERRGGRVDELLKHFADNPPMVSLVAPCGTHRKYARGCRCDECKAGESTYRADLKAKRNNVQAA